MSWVMFVEIATMFAEFLISFIFFKEFLGQKNVNKLLSSISAVLYIIIIGLVSTYIPNQAITFSISVLCFFLLSFLFDGNIKVKLFATFLLIVFMFMSDMITVYGIMWIGSVNTNAILDRGILAAVALIISKLMLILITKSVCHFRNRDNTHLSSLYWLALLIIPIISSIAIFTIYDLNYRINIADTSPLSFISMIGILFINILTFQLFEFFLQKAAIEMRENLLQQQVEAQIAQCKNLEFEQISKRTFLHDLKNHIQLLYNLVEGGKVAEALECISKILEVEAISEEYVHTGNTVIDAIFNAKIMLAEDRDIKVELDDIHIPYDVALSPTDMCVLFANSLDNAIEACDRITGGEKYIKIGLVYRNKRLVYKVTNPTDGNVVKGKKHYKSSKTTVGVHGLGIENMENVIKKYKGVFTTKHYDNDNIFELAFVIYNI